MLIVRAALLMNECPNYQLVIKWCKMIVGNNILTLSVSVDSLLTLLFALGRSTLVELNVFHDLITIQ